MKNFERIAGSPEALGAFLASMPVANAPWDDEFHKQFCADCLYLGCDSCPHEQFRNNPLWWLNKETAQEAPDYEFSPEDVAAIERMAQMEQAHDFPLMVIPDEDKGTLTITKGGVPLGLGGVEAVVLAQIILAQARGAK